MTQSASPYAPQSAPKAAAIVREVTVKAPIARAFEFFTAHMGRWWPATHHIAGRPFAEIVVEPETGGRWFERAADGEECAWGTVLDWDPPARVAFSWHLNDRWQFDPDPAHASRVEISFHPLDDHSTRVRLEHSEFERHGEGYEGVIKDVGAENGWTQILRNFTAHALAAGLEDR